MTTPRSDTAPSLPEAHERLGHIVVRLPALLPVLHRHQLDYCCGGNIPLAEACTKQGLDLEALLAEFEAILARMDEAVRMRGALPGWLDACWQVP